MRSKFLQKLDEDDKLICKGTEVKGGRDGLFIEKPDIVDKYCRREITEDNPELGALSLMQFAKNYQPIRGGQNEDDKYTTFNRKESSSQEQQDTWEDEEERVADFYVTTNEKYHHLRLPNIIRLKNCLPGDVTTCEKRVFPKAARIHEKKQNIDPHRFFLSEMILYLGFTDEAELGANDEIKCMEKYFENEQSINFVKKHLLPYVEGIEEARTYIQESLENQSNIGNLLDPEQEQEIVDCQEEEETMHPDFLHLDPENIEDESNVQQIKRMTRNIQEKTADEMLDDARKLDFYQKKALHIAIKYAQDILISRKGKAPSPKPPLLLIHGGCATLALAQL